MKVHLIDLRERALRDIWIKKEKNSEVESSSGLNSHQISSNSNQPDLPRITSDNLAAWTSLKMQNY